MVRCLNNLYKEDTYARCGKQTRTDMTRNLPGVMGLGGALAGLLAGTIIVLVSPSLLLVTGMGIWKLPRLRISAMRDETAKRLQATTILDGSL
jgi:hypothetical protein